MADAVADPRLSSFSGVGHIIKELTEKINNLERTVNAVTLRATPTVDGDGDYITVTFSRDGTPVARTDGSGWRLYPDTPRNKVDALQSSLDLIKRSLYGGWYWCVKCHNLFATEAGSKCPKDDGQCSCREDGKPYTEYAVIKFKEHQ